MTFTILYATDLHGSEQSYERLLLEAPANNADAIVLGGDLLTLENPQRQGLFLRGWLTPRLQRFHEQHPTIRIFGLLGNDDWKANEPEFNELETSQVLFGLHQRAHRLYDDLWIAGCSYVPVTPFGIGDWDRLDSPGWVPPAKPSGPLFSDGGKLVKGTMDDFGRRASIQEVLADISKLSDPAKTVYVMHPPPFQTNLDILYDGKHIGSRAIREYIDRWQPPLTLHGHIHESSEMSGSISDRIGRTYSLNPGDSKDQLRALLIGLGERILWRAVK